MKVVLGDVGQRVPHLHLESPALGGVDQARIPSGQAAATLPEETLREEVDVLLGGVPREPYDRHTFVRDIPVAQALTMCQLKGVLEVCLWHGLLMAEPDVGPRVQCHTAPRESRRTVSGRCGPCHVHEGIGEGYGLGRRGFPAAGLPTFGLPLLASLSFCFATAGTLAGPP